jgi:hypothetical protein
MLGHGRAGVLWRAVRPWMRSDVGRYSASRDPETRTGATTGRRPKGHLVGQEQIQAGCRNFPKVETYLPGRRQPIMRRTMPESKAKGLEKDPKCVKCGSKMRFSCTEPEPGQPGFVHHIYECTKCRSTQSFVTPI